MFTGQFVIGIADRAVERLMAVIEHIRSRFAKAGVTTHNMLNPARGQGRGPAQVRGQGLAGAAPDLTAPDTGRLDSGKRTRAVLPASRGDCIGAVLPGSRATIQAARIYVANSGL